ncbi:MULTISPECIES: inositol monophosphatase [unclassified Lentimonas]|uniref:inositol monophosphatase family protein n=1 Tax=unclassified Lentimonas TaxID=2630993 RepID=UPI0013273F3F|nr:MULTISPECIES: inositol monophosphatase [unclassified Lentimonas]CAA6679086.1 Histidinol-phosphatase [alternative form] (EC [Lentimonas sp. CC4]CAA6684174.1 Histidinol-phosphatase [alternative form] (EC [Lentimonas sp. CC6]
MKKPLSRQAKAQFDLQLRHRINAGRVAVKEQTAFFGRQFAQVVSEWKEDDTRVTFADFAISENLFAALRRDFAHDNYCSEEASPQDEVLELEAPFTWVVDPIDGTNNYALGFPVCAISLALLHDGVPVYGFVYDYSTQSLLEGGAGFGVLRNQKKVNRDRMAADAQTMLGLHFPMDGDILVRLQPLLEKYRVRCLGSGALTACYVATGYLTGVVDFRVKVWDIAAAYALCEGAGVSFEFLGERPFPMKTFHPQVDFCPYLAGTETFCAELNAALRTK